MGHQIGTRWWLQNWDPARMFFFKEKAAFEAKKTIYLSWLAHPGFLLVDVLASCWFLLLNPAKGTVGMAFSGSQFLWNNWPTAWLLEVSAIFLAFLEWELVASKPSCLITLWTCSSFALHFPPVSSPRPWEWGSPPALPSPSQASKHEAVYRQDGETFVSLPRHRRPGYKNDARLVPEHHLAKHVESSALLHQSFA